MRACPRCKVRVPKQSRLRWYERVSGLLTRARPYRCLACGRRYWARPSSARTTGLITTKDGAVFADRRGKERGRRKEDAERTIPTDWFELQTDIDDEEPARAVTFKDVIKLSRAGIGEVVLLDLIETDDIACPTTPSRLKALKGAGASDQVLLALLRNGRSADDDQPAAARSPRPLEDESIDRVLPHEGVRSMRAARHA